MMFADKKKICHPYVRVICTITTILCLVPCNSTSPSGVFSTKGRIYDLTSNIRLTGVGTSTMTKSVADFTHCVILGLADTGCLSVSYDRSTDLCHINQVVITNSGVQVEYDNNFLYTEISKGTTEWAMVFRATQGIGQQVWTAWNNVGHDDMTSVSSDSIGCLTLDGRLLCNTHFRSWRLDDWKNIKEVKVALYTDAIPVFYMVFNASETTHKDEFYSISRIIQSSSSQLVGYTGLTNYNSAYGLDYCFRRFYLSQYHNGCDTDLGWVKVSDDWQGGPCCVYESTGNHPQFTYTKTGTAIRWVDSDNVGQAQVFAVFIKYNDL